MDGVSDSARPHVKSTLPYVVYWTHSPTPYFVERFNAVAERGDLRFEAWFNERRQSDRSWTVDESTWRFPARYIPRHRWLRPIGPVPFAELRDSRPDVLVQEYDRFHLSLGFAAGLSFAGRSVLRVLPNFDEWSRRTWWRELGKHAVLSSADAAKVPGADGRALAVRYGMPAARVIRVQQTVDVELYSSASRIDAQRRQNLRVARGVSGCTFLFIGRLWRGKGLDYLFDAYAQVAAARSDVSLLLVGDGVDEERYRQRAQCLPRVRFEGFIQQRDLPQIYALSDVFVFPTLGDPHGLVVEEAMSAGLPVISTRAAGDIEERLVRTDSGIVVEPKDAASLGKAMLELAASRELRHRLGANARAERESWRHDCYAADFCAMIEQVLDSAPRRGAWRSILQTTARCERLLARRPSVRSFGPGERVEADRTDDSMPIRSQLTGRRR